MVVMVSLCTLTVVLPGYEFRSSHLYLHITDRFHISMILLALMEKKGNECAIQSKKQKGTIQLITVVVMKNASSY